LGQEDNRNRRRRQLPTIKNKIMCLDFVLAHRTHEYLATEQDKLAYFTHTLQLEASLLPAKRYASHGQITERYFIEKFPLFLSPSSHAATPPVVSFCFVDEGACGLSGFWTFLNRYRGLLTHLRESQVIYVAGPGGHFEAAGKAFARFLNREQAPCDHAAPNPSVARMLEHFEARYAYETQQWSSFDRTKMIRLRNERDEFSGPEVEALYSRWKAKGQAAVVDTLEPKPLSPEPVHSTFSTTILEHNYALFDNVAVI
jgi:hypothetical protein